MLEETRLGQEGSGQGWEQTVIGSECDHVSALWLPIKRTQEGPGEAACEPRGQVGRRGGPEGGLVDPSGASCARRSQGGQEPHGSAAVTPPGRRPRPGQCPHSPGPRGPETHRDPAPRGSLGASPEARERPGPRRLSEAACCADHICPVSTHLIRRSGRAGLSQPPGWLVPPREAEAALLGGGLRAGPQL